MRNMGFFGKTPGKATVLLFTAVSNMIIEKKTKKEKN